VESLIVSTFGHFIIGTNRSRRMRWAIYLARIREMRIEKILKSENRKGKEI
jgi:hypothetical protein